MSVFDKHSKSVCVCFLCFYKIHSFFQCKTKTLCSVCVLPKTCLLFWVQEKSNSWTCCVYFQLFRVCGKNQFQSKAGWISELYVFYYIIMMIFDVFKTFTDFSWKSRIIKYTNVCLHKDDVFLITIQSFERKIGFFFNTKSSFDLNMFI